MLLVSKLLDLLKELIDFFDFFFSQADRNSEIVKIKTSTFGWMWSGIPEFKLNCHTRQWVFLEWSIVKMTLEEKLNHFYGNGSVLCRLNLDLFSPMILNNQIKQDSLSIFPNTTNRSPIDHFIFLNAFRYSEKQKSLRQ